MIPPPSGGRLQESLSLTEIPAGGWTASEGETMARDMDLAILTHASTFGLGLWLPEPHTGGGTIIKGETISEAAQYGAAKRLVSHGYLTEKLPEKWSQRKRSNLIRYEITDAGRAAMRAYLGTPDLTVDHARGLHVSDLRTTYGDLPLAQRQIELRERGGAVVRGALAILGQRYSGTGGWHVSAFVADAAIGFVNTALGIAVLTTATLDAETIEALTVPAQSQGPVASGAAYWTSPDAGTPQHAEAPDGWVQLLVDLRTSAGEVAEITCSARVVRWGLRTCYAGRRGEPGRRELDPRSKAERIDPREWPMPSQEVHDRMHAIGETWLDSVTRRLADLAGCGPEVRAALDGPHAGPVYYASACIVEPRLPARDLAAAWAASQGKRRPCDYSAQHAVASAVCRVTHGVVSAAMETAGITEIARLAGDVDDNRVSGLRYYDVMSSVLESILVQRLTPAAEALWTALWPFTPEPKPEDQEHHRCWHLDLHVMQPMIESIAGDVAGLVLCSIAEEAAAIEQEILSAYYAQGAVTVDYPCTVYAGED